MYLELTKPCVFSVFVQKVILVTKSLNVYPLTPATIMVQIASHILAYTNSCVNPILYAFLSDSFRKAFRKIIYCKPRPDQNRQLGPLTRTTRAASSGDILQVSGTYRYHYTVAVKKSFSSFYFDQFVETEIKVTN